MTISAFHDTASGTIVITGVNDSSSPQTMQCKLLNLPAVTTLKYYFTDASHNFVPDSDVPVGKQAFSKLIRPKCAFTFVGKGGIPASAGGRSGK
jgi:hypothetical protein